MKVWYSLQTADVLLRAGNETLPQCKSNATDFGTPLWNDEIDDIRELLCFGIGYG